MRQVIPRDAIPCVDEPTFDPENSGNPDDEVVVLDREPPKAYPVRILHYHEIVNDEVALDGADGGTVPVAVTWCPLCGSAVVYDRRVDGLDGSAPAFGVSGKLADDDLVMYDRETGSEWKQSSGECIVGDLAGESLSVLPAAMVPYRRFRDANPDGVVLQRPGGASEAAGAGDDPEPIDYDAEPYDAYFEMAGFGLAAHRGEDDDRRTWDRDDVDPKTVVLGVEADDEAVGFPLPVVRDAGGAVRATVGDRPVVVFATPDGIHAFADPGYEFEPMESADAPEESADGSIESADESGDWEAGPLDGAGFRADGTTWDGATGEAADGRSLERLPARRLFAFAWQDDHGPDAFYRE